jgi:transcriptional regulator with XRE-family HTH domain
MVSFARNSDSFTSRRIAAGLSMDELSQQLGVSIGDIHDWESGAKLPPAHVEQSIEIIERMDSAKAKKNEPMSEINETAHIDQIRSEGHSPDSLIKSKQRVTDHGEVFTPPWLVEKMLDLVKGETERIDSKFLEPACGSGNFLVPILKRKLAAVEAKYGRSEFEKSHFALLALTSLYGIELLADNIAECRANMLDVFAEYLGITDEDDGYRAGSHVLSLNLIHGDAMTMKDADGSPITVVEWAYLGKGKFNRRDFRLDVLTGMAEFREEQSLFQHLGSHEIFQPTRAYAPMRMRELAALDPHSDTETGS